MTDTMKLKADTRSAREATEPNGPTGRLATWLANTTLADVPSSVREHAKHLLLDGVACALVGAQLPVSRNGVEGVTALEDAGTAAIIGWGGPPTPPPAPRAPHSASAQASHPPD